MVYSPTWSSRLAEGMRADVAKWLKIISTSYTVQYSREYRISDVKVMG